MIYPVEPAELLPYLIATFGIAIHPTFRSMGHGKEIMSLVTTKAHEMGIKTLRADIYEDNTKSIRVLVDAGFRKFIWMEKNL